MVSSSAYFERKMGVIPGKLIQFIILISDHFWSDSFSLDFMKECRVLLHLEILFQSSGLL